MLAHRLSTVENCDTIYILKKRKFNLKENSINL